jgi:hypothetical protein
MIHYYCPGFVESQKAYKILFWLRDNASQCFYENVQISKIYGCFPNMIWNGGSYWFGPCLSRNQIIDYFEWYSHQNVQLQLTFTNPILEETDLYDRYCNAILEIASNYDFVEVLVSSDILEKYIRSKYPNIKIDKSIIATTRDRESVNDSLKGYLQNLETYNMCVLPRKHGKNFDFLNQIPEDKRNRFEILATDPCPINCPRLYTHYEDMAKAQLWIPGGVEHSHCTTIHPDNPFKQWQYRNQRISYEELHKYEELGFTEIKLSGRTDMIQMIITVVPYLIKPEYQQDVYAALLNDFKDYLIQPDFS